MLAILRKELKLYFGSFMTYLILGAVLLLFGVLSSILNLFMGYASLTFPLSYMNVLTIIFIPLLSLLQYLRTGKKDSEKLLLSLPVSPVSIVLGKFLAIILLILIPVLVMALVPFLFSAWGGNALATSEMAVFGYFLLCVLLLAITQLIFSGIKRKWLAITLAFAVPILLYVLHSVLSLFYFDGIAKILVCLIDPFHHFYSFTYGAFDLTGTVYFLTFSAFFLLLNVLVLKKKRGCFYASNRHHSTVVLTSVLLAGILFFNVGAMLLPEKLSTFDVSGLNIFRISGKTVDLLKALDEDVKIYYLCQGGSKNADSDIHSFLKKYAEESNYLQLEIVDTEKNPDFSKQYTDVTLSDQSMLIVSGKRHYAVDFNDLYYYENASMGLRFSPTDYAYLTQTYVNYLQTGSLGGVDETTMATIEQLFYSTSTAAFFDGESALTNAIQYVVSTDVPTVYIPISDAFTTPDSSFITEILENGFFIRYISSLNSIPEDCDLLLLFSPKNDLQTEEMKELRSYLANGGNLFVVTDYSKTELTGLYSLLSEYGLCLAERSNILCEGNEDKLLENEAIFQAKVLATPATDGKFDRSFTAIMPHSIVLEEREDVTLTPWITTTEKGYLLYTDDEDGVESDIEYTTLVCGALAEQENTRIAWISSPLSISSMGVTYSSGGNYTLVLSSFRWMTSSAYEKLTFIANEMTAAAISLTDGQISVWTLIFTVPLPLATLLIGGIRTYVRKKK
ncbi:MAG: Gldg family protein [Clostridia bacterium]|nr:Gldg family protein [Clostridia bacterium]